MDVQQTSTQIDTQIDSNFRAICKFPVPTSSTSTTATSNITVYDLHITSSTPPLLCISGTHGITIISYASLSTSFTTLSPPPPGLSVPTIPNPKVLHTFHPHPSSSESSPIEVNCVSSHPSRPSLIYAACGDQFGVYEFDVQASRLVREMGGGGGGVTGGGYLHAVCVLGDDGNVVASGGEGGGINFHLGSGPSDTWHVDGGLEGRREGGVRGGRGEGWTSSLTASSGGDFLLGTGGYTGSEGGGWVVNVHLGSRSVVGKAVTEEPNNCSCRLASGGYLVGGRDGAVREYGMGGLGRVGVMRGGEGMEIWGVKEGRGGIKVVVGMEDGIIVDRGWTGGLERVGGGD
ncbi:hypothetical protein TrCOL_g614 [Triparma columacea]|uniref:Uncharacterized protein n=1 Tax=Triparma columacea TaxID=722753 RepID=A0A9W7L275_9STRA|nr:hypothetical protein TrCOL_g614 [Triparma columacea]